MSLTDLFKRHIDRLQKYLDAELERLKTDRLILLSGSKGYYFQDDTSYPFKASAYFNHFCPDPNPGHILVVSPEHKPKLFYYKPEDFWHEVPECESQFWTQYFDIEFVSDTSEPWALINIQPGDAVIGPEKVPGLESHSNWNPENILKSLNWLRCEKSDYEIECLRTASKKGANGHRFARKAFESGASEFEIAIEFFKGSGLRESELPYPPIVALNDKSAILHYQHYRHHCGDGNVLLIDAGAGYLGYGSDITRTYGHPEKASKNFLTILKGMNQLQQDICAKVSSKICFSDLHELCHVKISNLLIDTDLVRSLDVDTCIDYGISALFMPHGLGHMLGLQTHDVGGGQTDSLGTRDKGSVRFPKLHMSRQLRVNEVLTIEPGLYFIPMLLNQFRSNKHKKHINWNLVDKLIPFGGIRVEDNLRVLESGHENFTRNYLKE